MLIIKRRPDINGSEITDRELFLQRRRFMRNIAVAATAGPALLGQVSVQAGTKLANVRKTGYGADAQLTPYEYVTSYNNFYEFGTDKKDPAKYAGKMKISPWNIAVEGECGKPGVYGIDDFIKPHVLEERIYRFRCVEAWSMVVPWVGIPLANVLKRFEPNSRAKYVAFETLHDPEQMPGQKSGFFGGGLEWPYREGLRIDEAMHPLSIFAVGVYGEVLPNQNGAPLRLIWRGVAKSERGSAAPDSALEIRFQEHQVHCQGEFHGTGTGSNLEPDKPEGIWLLFQCQPRCRSPALESKARTQNRC